MALTDYTETPRGNGYRGYRVFRTVAGVRHQYYFHRTQGDLARHVDAKLAEKQQAEGGGREGAQLTAGCLGQPRWLIRETETGVCGLRLAFASERGYPGRATIKLQFEIGDEKIRHVRRIGPTSNTIAQAWHSLTTLLAQYKGLGRRPRAWIDAEPTVEQFHALARVERARGRRIDEEYLQGIE